MKTLIQNCRIISPGVDLPRGGIVMENGMISSVGEITEQESFDTVIAGSGLSAAPGFIDIHFHGRSDYDFCDGSAKAFEVIGKGKLQDGVTGFLATSLSVSYDFSIHPVPERRIPIF